MQSEPIKRHKCLWLLDFCSWCCSVTLPLSVASVDFSEQFVLAGKCHATLSALPPPPPPHTSATHCLSLSPSLFLPLPFTSWLQHGEFLPSPLFTSYHVLCFSLSASLLSPAKLTLSGTESATEQNVFIFNCRH